MNIVNNVVGYVGTHMAALPSLRMPTFMTNTLAKMTEQQKKIALVVSIIISTLAALFIAYQCCFRRRVNYGGGDGGGGGGFLQPAPAPAPIGGGGGNQNNNNNLQPAPFVPQPQPYNPLLNNFKAPAPNLNNIPVPADETLNLREVENQIHDLKFDIAEGKQDLEVLENEKQSLEISLVEIRSAKEKKVLKPVEENKDADKAADAGEKEAVVEENKVDEADKKEAIVEEEKLEEADKKEEKEDVLPDPALAPAPIDADPAKDEKLVEAVPPAPVAEEEGENETIILEVQIIDKQEQIEEKEKYIKQLEAKLEKALQDYGQTLRLYLEKQFNNQNYYHHNNKDNNEIHEHIVKLIETMDTYKDKNSFVVENLTQINLFLANAFFTKGHYLDEGKKVDLAVFNHFYAIVDAHFPTLQKEDPALAQQLKIKLANLPLIDDIDRSKFTHAHLNETDQLNLLIAHFEKKEKDTVKTVVQQFKDYKTKNLTEQEVKKLAKLASENRTHLANVNKYTLQDELKDFLKQQAPADWDNDQTVYEALKKFFNPAPNPYDYQQYNNYNYNYNYDYNQKAPVINGILTLYRTSKARQFFDDQLGLEENQIQIPRWYHATKPNAIQSIIREGKIEVRHQQAYSGVWVSTQREITFGNHTIVFNHRIAKLDPKVFIGYTDKPRWRGLQVEVPIIESKAVEQKPAIPYVTYAGVPKAAQNANKTAIIALLKQQGIKKPVVFHNEQIDFIRQEIIDVLGSPNLSEHWWGKGDMANAIAIAR